MSKQARDEFEQAKHEALIEGATAVDMLEAMRAGMRALLTDFTEEVASRGETVSAIRVIEILEDLDADASIVLEKIESGRIRWP